MFGVGATEMAGVLATGEIWLAVPETIEIEWRGRFGKGVVAKDAMLFLCGQLGMDFGRTQAVHFRGDAIGSLGMQERMTLANMTTELGGQTGLCDPDESTVDYFRAAGSDPGDISYWQSDAEALPAERHAFDATSLVPQVAAPHSPANAAPATDHSAVRIDVAHIGACTGAKLADLRMAAAVLKGRKVDSGVSLLVAPASRRDQDAAAQDGTLQAIVDAGATLLPNACGMCAGYNGTLGENVTCISSIARNFKGRMGTQSASIWLGSPYTVAASAVRGRITDPRDLLS
jgi:3-isopropylmalate/(R)-2-methylmalate dehydratase large subunit